MSRRNVEYSSSEDSSLSLAEDDDVDRQQSPSQGFGDEDEDEEEGFVADDARSQVTFDDENIFWGEDGATEWDPRKAGHGAGNASDEFYSLFYLGL